MAFRYNKGIRQGLVDKGEPVDSGVTTTSFPTDFTNKFVARMKDENIDPNKQSLGGVYSNEEATRFTTEKLPTLDNVPYFPDEESNLRANDFLNKYRASFIQPDEEKVSAESTLGYIAGDPNSNLKGGFPGGMKVS